MLVASWRPPSAVWQHCHMWKSAISRSLTYIWSSCRIFAARTKADWPAGVGNASPYQAVFFSFASSWWSHTRSEQFSKRDIARCVSERTTCRPYKASKIPPSSTIWKTKIPRLKLEVVFSHHHFTARSFLGFSGPHWTAALDPVQAKCCRNRKKAGNSKTSTMPGGNRGLRLAMSAPCLKGCEWVQVDGLH